MEPWKRNGRKSAPSFDTDYAAEAMAWSDGTVHYLTIQCILQCTRRNCPPKRVVKEQLPFEPLNLAGEFFLGRTRVADALHRVNKTKGITVLEAEGSGLFREPRKYRMVPDAAEPILGVGSVRLPAVHDAVPVTAGVGVNLL